MARGFADLPRDPCIMAMHFDTAEPIFADGGADNAGHPAPVIHRMDECKAKEPVRMAPDDRGDGGIGPGVVRVKGRKKIGSAYPCFDRPAKEFSQGRPRIPGSRKAIAFSRVAMCIDDQHMIRFGSFHHVTILRCPAG